MTLVRKDRALVALAEKFNVAQFVSFAPESKSRLVQQHARVVGFPADHLFDSPSAALFQLLRSSPEGTINLRSYSPDSPHSREFVYGIASHATAVEIAERLAAHGLYIIANETINVCDGGVSGVIEREVIEFAPDDTPRCVEKPGTASLPRDMAISILSKVYGFEMEVGDSSHSRIEFSIHPLPRGWKRAHTVLWEQAPAENEVSSPRMVWPNRFSAHIGDKTFGLLMAECAGVSVPRTTVFGRRVAPFSFGRPTGGTEVWMRTAPREPQPGRFVTRKGWADPFALMAKDDPKGEVMALLCQWAIPAAYSGAALVTAEGELLIEGRRGEGDKLMLGVARAELLPTEVISRVESMFHALAQTYGPVRFEWVYDGSSVWVVQLHRGQTQTSATVLVPGEAEQWVSFEASLGLDALRLMLADLPAHSGIQVLGEIGLTSHLADLIRQSRRPAKLRPMGAAI